MNEINKDLFYALIAREGIKTALMLREIYKEPWDTEEQIEKHVARINELGSRTASDYEDSRQS